MGIQEFRLQISLKLDEARFLPTRPARLFGTLWYNGNATDHRVNCELNEEQ